MPCTTIHTPTTTCTTTPSSSPTISTTSTARTLVTNEIKRFFDRNLCQYDYKDYPVCFVGTIATRYSELLLQVAYSYNMNVKKIVSESMPGLVAYHSIALKAADKIPTQLLSIKIHQVNISGSMDFFLRITITFCLYITKNMFIIHK